MTETTSKPLMQMTKSEFDDAMLRLGEDVIPEMVRAARGSKNQTIKFVMAVLEHGADKTLLCVDIEYGDGEGTRYVKDFMKDVRGLRLLERGERLRMKIGEIVPDLS